MNTATRIAGVFVLMVILAAPSLFVSCNSKGTEAVDEPNLLSNGSFEVDGKPTFSGWTPGDSILVAVVAQPAPHSGLYSLQLTADWAPTLGYVRATIPELQDGDIVRLGAYVRALDSDGGGSISVNAGDAAALIPSHRKLEYTTSTSWTYLTVTDTLSVDPGDSVWVELSSPATEIVPRVGLFDQVTLVRLDN